MAGKGGAGPRAKRDIARSAPPQAEAPLALPPEVLPNLPAANANLPAPRAPSLYLVNPLLVGPLAAWPALFAHVASLGCTAVLLAPPTQPGPTGNLFHLGDPDQPHPCLEAPSLPGALAQLVAAAHGHGLALYLDLVLDRAASASAFVARHPTWFNAAAGEGPPDPRLPLREVGTCAARLEGPGLQQDWAFRLQGWVEVGVAGFRCLHPQAVPPAFWRRLTAALPCTQFIAWTPGLAAPAQAALAGLGFSACCNSLAWWDLRGEWLTEESRRLAGVAPALATVEPPFGPRLAAAAPTALLAERHARRHLMLAAACGTGLVLPMGCEYGAPGPLDATRDRPGDWAALQANPPLNLRDAVRAATAAVARQGLERVELQPLTGPDGRVAALLADQPGAPRVVVANASLHAEARLPVAPLLAQASLPLARLLLPDGAPLNPGDEVRLAPGEVLVLATEAAYPVPTLAAPEFGLRQAIAAAAAPRIGIEAVTPVVDAGRFPTKHLLGESVTVSCDLVCDGHDKLAAMLTWRAADDNVWSEVPLRPLGNDRWAASFPLQRLGRHVFRVEAWRDAFATWRDDVEKKHAAGLDLTLELEEGRLLLAPAATRAGGALQEMAAALAQAAPAERLHVLLAAHTARLMAAADDRPFRAISAEMPVDAERRAAAFAAWYELFPRNYGGFRGVIGELPHIRAMGFDVLYFPPIHPIGRSNRKGRNNSLQPATDDPGSPYAIGSETGGHDALEPGLGTLDDFAALREAAARHGLELALDFAIQCSPDHPWLKQHPEWFDWRPDGSLRYAENPPKKYQDIVNVDFYREGAAPSLWLALRDVVRFWCDHGIRIFRVDNPHTKPLPFWEWLIGDIRAQHPDAIFLAEAFTRPKVMHRLGKLGFTQSYSYFTWRNSKAEITDYLEELATPEIAAIYRPNFFVNTPDINPPFLQTGGRAAHLIRAALAATTGALWGVFQGFELCDAAGLPGREEYLDSDKYEIRQRPQRAPGDIVDEITRLNAIRRANPALQRQTGIAFHHAFNDQVLWFRRQDQMRDNVLLIGISLDPLQPQQASVELPLWEWGLPDGASLEAEELMHGHQFTWHGKQQVLRFHPAMPFAIWRVRPAGDA